MKRTYAYRDGKLTEISSREPTEIRHSNGDRIIQEGTMAERVMLGFRDQEQKHGSEFNRKLPFSPSHIRRVWSEGV